MTREQIQRIYNAKMQHIMQKIAKDKQVQDDADRAVWQKEQDDKAKISGLLTSANMYKDLVDWRRRDLLSIEYGGEGEITELGRPTKYKTKEDRPFGEVVKPKNWW